MVESGKTGGYLQGKRHSEGGIKAINNSTNQPIEMEGGEVVITRNAVSDSTKREFDGQQLTNREILSKINQSGGGVAFEEGGEIKSCRACGKEYKHGGTIKTDFEIIDGMNEYDIQRMLKIETAKCTTVKGVRGRKLWQMITCNKKIEQAKKEIANNNSAFVKNVWQQILFNWEQCKNSI